MSRIHLAQVLEKALEEERLSRDEMRLLLEVRKDDGLEETFQAARTLRERHFGTGVFLYGFVYFSTWCRNRCTFCLYRAGNDRYKHYRKTADEVLEIARGLKETGVNLIDLTMGEDPLYHREGFAPLIDLVRAVKEETGLPVMVSPGVVPWDVMCQMADAGADWYACYQETHNRTLFEFLRPGQDYDVRLNSKKQAMEAGLLSEDGILTGVGDTLEDVAASVDTMGEIGCQQVRVMGFVPQAGTPMEREHVPLTDREARIIAVLRICHPRRMIPASLDVDGLAGLARRLEAGANVVTSLIPAHKGLAGVSQHSLDIDDGNRSVQGVLPVLKAAGLTAASTESLREWIQKERLALPALTRGPRS